MAPREVDLKLVQAAYLLKNRSDRSPAEVLVEFDHVVNLVNKTYKTLPWDNKDDPGAYYECECILRTYTPQTTALLTDIVELNKRHAPHDLRLIRARESLREAYHVAYSNRRGFRGIGRPPELQQLIAATCIDVYASHLLWPKVSTSCAHIKAPACINKQQHPRPWSSPSQHNATQSLSLAASKLAVHPCRLQHQS